MRSCTVRVPRKSLKHTCTRPRHVAERRVVRAKTGPQPSMPALEKLKMTMTSSPEADATNLAIATALRYMTLSSEHNLSEVSKLMNDQAQYKSDALNIEVTGRDAIMGMMGGFFGKFTDVTWETTGLKAVEKTAESVRIEVDFIRRWTDPETGVKETKASREWITVNPVTGEVLKIHVAAFDS